MITRTKPEAGLKKIKEEWSKFLCPRSNVQKKFDFQIRYLFPASISCTSQGSLSYKLPSKHFNSQKAYFDNFNKNIGLWIVCMNDECNSTTSSVVRLQLYWQCNILGQFLKPYAAPSVKQLEPSFHWTQKYFIKM